MRQGIQPTETDPIYFGVISFTLTTIALNRDPASTLPIYSPF